MNALKFTLPVWIFLALLALTYANAVIWYFPLLAALAIPGMLAGEYDEATLRRDLRFFYTDRRMQWVKMGSASLLVVFNGVLLWLVATRSMETVHLAVLMLAVALNNGMFLLSLAHDLSHADSAAKRWLGNLLLFTVCLPFFRADHIFGHHEQVGTHRDAGSAKLNQSFYSFLICAFRQRIWRGYSRNSDLPDYCKTAVRSQNRWFTAALAAFGTALFLIQPVLLLFWLGQSVLVYVQYELANYIQHFGLRRAAGEAVGLEHAWNSYYKYANWTVWCLWIHSPHHTERPVHELRLLSGPRMPFPPFVMLLLALVPALWFRVMNPLVYQLQIKQGQALQTGIPQPSVPGIPLTQKYEAYDPSI